MPREKLRQHLKELHEALSDHPTLDAEDHRLISQLAGDLEQVLKEKSRVSPTLRDKVHESARQFEVSHPTIAGVIQRLGEILQQSGI